ncbi:adenosylcobinamide-phosphate synthase CbiB [Thalassotalea ganghwensis]
MDIITTLTATLIAFKLSFVLTVALLLDKWLGEAKRYHYLVGFGWLAKLLERHLNNLNKSSTTMASASVAKLKGLIAWMILTLPLPLFYALVVFELPSLLQLFFDIIIVYLAISLTSLHQHALQIYHPLKTGNINLARTFTGYIVSRDTQQLDTDEVTRATVESVLENGHDGVIASLLYYLVGGAPLVILHRFANTLDAMWGYKNKRYLNFGFFPAKLDDLLGFISAKYCTALYALQGQCIRAFANAYHQGSHYKSYNGGWVMASGATVLDRKLGGDATYENNHYQSVSLGTDKALSIEDIPRSLTVVRKACLYAVSSTFIIELMLNLIH